MSAISGPASAAPTLSIVIPAYNEEKILAETLALINAAVARYRSDCSAAAEIIVVDNASTDSTPSVAANAGARVVPQPVRSIGRTRNAGARAASADWIFFVDADTAVPAAVLVEIDRALSIAGCAGGAIAVDYQPKKRSLQIYTRLWGYYAAWRKMEQGVAMFVTRQAFEAVGGFNEAMRMGEDTQFYWDLQKWAKRNGGHVTRIATVEVKPSTRRYDTWPAWKVILRTNPVATRLFLRSERLWKGWYDEKDLVR